MDASKKIKTSLFGLSTSDVYDYITTISETHQAQLAEKEQKIEALEKQVKTLRENLDGLSKVSEQNDLLSGQVARLTSQQQEWEEKEKRYQHLQKVEQENERLRREISTLQNDRDTFISERINVSNALIRAQAEANKILQDARGECVEMKRKTEIHMQNEIVRAEQFKGRVLELKTLASDIIGLFVKELGETAQQIDEIIQQSDEQNIDADTHQQTYTDEMEEDAPGMSDDEVTNLQQSEIDFDASLLESLIQKFENI